METSNLFDLLTKVFDLFDCDGEQMQNDEINFEPKSDD